MLHGIRGSRRVDGYRGHHGREQVPDFGHGGDQRGELEHLGERVEEVGAAVGRVVGEEDAAFDLVPGGDEESGEEEGGLEGEDKRCKEGGGGEGESGCRGGGGGKGWEEVEDVEGVGGEEEFHFVKVGEDMAADVEGLEWCGSENFGVFMRKAVRSRNEG
ncbi:hypothetical protein HDU93_003480 [Gonapodya sp. JEL0774]|nr:hypothetical protein HDU93_003480 [Gonapodya sp. JEL0774]